MHPFASPEDRERPARDKRAQAVGRTTGEGVGEVSEE